MKKVLYFALLLAELFVGVLLLSALWNSGLYIPIIAAAVAVIGLLIWQIILYTKADEFLRKRRILFNIVVVMLIPSIVFFITFVTVAISFIIAFA